MRRRLQREAELAAKALRRLDAQTVTVLVATAVLVILQLKFGSRRFFRTEISDLFPESIIDIGSWGWWFSMQGITGFVVPVLILLVLFRRKPSEVGLGAGDVKLAGWLALLYLPVVVAGTWVLSNGSGFLSTYPHFSEAARDWRLFFVYEMLYILYWIGWEYLWRGFVLFGTAHTFGVYAIVVQAVPFAILHADKPLAEGLLSVVGGLVLGAVVWRCRSFWIAVPIHAVQMLSLDLFCSLRLRTGARGIGLEALIKALGGA
jgi:hypothetical protein